MGIISTPSMGQPIDVAFLYNLAVAINDLSDRISVASNQRYTTIIDRDSGRQDVKTSDAKIYAGYTDIVDNTTVVANDTRAFSFNFSSDFKYPPIVTATIVNRGTSAIGNDVSVVITSVTTSRIDGVVRFSSSGSVSTTVNVIAIGIAP